MLAVLRSDRNGKHSTFSLVHGTLHPIHANPLEVIVLLSLYLAVLDDQSKEEQFIDFCPHACNYLQMCGHFFVEASKADKILNFFQKSCHKHSVNYVD